MWGRRSNMLESLTHLIPNKIQCKGDEFKQKAFKEIQPIMGSNTLVDYPLLNKRFEIHTNAINFKIGDVNSQ